MTSDNVLNVPGFDIVIQSVVGEVANIGVFERKWCGCGAYNLVTIPHLRRLDDLPQYASKMNHETYDTVLAENCQAIVDRVHQLTAVSAGPAADGK